MVVLAEIYAPGAVCPQCHRRHRDWHRVAQCRWKRGLLWVQGNPPPTRPAYACVSYCRHPGYRYGTITVTLWPTEAEAMGAKALIDRVACGGSCSRRHKVYELTPAD
jgi:hypothetical protein